MKPLPILIGLIIASVVFYLLWTKMRNQKTEPDTDSNRPAEDYLPTQLKQNDKLVIIKEIGDSDLHTVLTGFCNMYNKAKFQAQPRLTKISEREFAVTFPYDIDFEIFCYFINYVAYPMELEKTIKVTAWTTTKSSDSWITEKSANKQAMLFIPSDDTEHDNVFMTTSDKIGYKLGFAMGEEKQILDSPKRTFSLPTLNISELSGKNYVDFK